MKKGLSLLVVLSVILMLMSVSVSIAAEKSYGLGYEIIKKTSGAMQLKITTSALVSGLWLGITFYTPTVAETDSQVYPIKLGKGITEIEINPKFVNGTFEAAVWTKKLSKKECLTTDAFCQKNGYSLTGMTAYLWRYIISP